MCGTWAASSSRCLRELDGPPSGKALLKSCSVCASITPEQVAKMEKGMESLQRDLINVVLARGYVSKLFENPR